MNWVDWATTFMLSLPSLGKRWNKHKWLGIQKYRSYLFWTMCYHAIWKILDWSLIWSSRPKAVTQMKWYNLFSSSPIQIHSLKSIRGLKFLLLPTLVERKIAPISKRLWQHWQELQNWHLTQKRQNSLQNNDSLSLGPVWFARFVNMPFVCLMPIPFVKNVANTTANTVANTIAI